MARVDADEGGPLDWNVIVTLRRHDPRVCALLGALGEAAPTGLFNVLVMRVEDIHALLAHLEERPPDDPLRAAIGRVLPVTHKLTFATADELEQQVEALLLGWAPALAGRSLHVRMRRRGHKGELHALDLERRLGAALLAELARQGTPGRIALDDPDVVISIELLGTIAGVAVWSRAELARSPLLRASIERGAARRVPIGAPSAPSRRLRTTTAERARHGRSDVTATAADLRGLLGELPPRALRQLLATGATVGEVAEAMSALEDEDACGEIHHGPSSAREAAVRAILEALLFEDAEERADASDLMRT